MFWKRKPEEPASEPVVAEPEAVAAPEPAPVEETVVPSGPPT